MNVEGGLYVSALTANSPVTLSACMCVQVFHIADEAPRYKGKSAITLFNVAIWCYCSL